MNPLYNTNDSPTNQTTPSKAVNRQSVYVPRTHNSFDMSYFNYKTQRFGQYEPFFMMECVPGDHIPFSSSHNVRSLPFATPFLSSLKLNKDYFLVPNQAIQPNTWELIFKNPSQGDDVPADAYNIFPLFNSDGSFDLLRYLFENIFDQLSTVPDSTVLYKLLTLELFCSSGSLLYNSDFKLNPIITDGSGLKYSFDEFFDEFSRNILLDITIDVDNRSVFLSNNYDLNPDSYVPTNVILDLIRFFGSSVTISRFEVTTSFDAPMVENLPRFNTRGSYINMDRLCAYQLACAQYFVNPQVDFLYNAQLYRDNFLASVMNLGYYNTNTLFFDYNGIRVQYDAFSRHTYGFILLALFESPEGWMNSIYDILSLLFGFKESLKFGDYFTDSRTKPLAVGNTDIQVQVDNSVSVVDVSQKIVLQRFLNNVVKLGNNFGDYLRGIFGTSPSPDYHFPKYIIHQEFDISGFETANTTSTDQGTVTSQLMTGDDTFVFEIDVDMPCILIGISHFSVPMVYCQTKDRHFQHNDRFDFFNPMLQYTGDQPVYLCEKTDLIDPNTDICGYQSRYGEYKQRVSVASGGFLTKLPAWAFVADDLFNEYRDLNLSLVQSPVSIRHQPYQFDRFFKALSGYSLSNAFHFVVVYNNKCMCNRPMEINPNIL